MNDGILPIKKGTVCSGLGNNGASVEYFEKGRRLIEKLKEEKTYKDK